MEANKTIVEVNALVQQVREKDVPDLKKDIEVSLTLVQERLESVSGKVEESMDIATEVIETFRGGVHLNFGNQGAAAQTTTAASTQAREKRNSTSKKC